jgi:transcriptional regulator with XRE-family HTH domain
MQREMTFLYEVRAMQNAPDELVKKCRDALDAIRLCVQLSGYTHEFLAETLGIDRGAFSRMMQGRASFPDRKRIDLMSLCGNRAPAQFDALMTGCELRELSAAARIRELEEQLEAAKAAERAAA